MKGDNHRGLVDYVVHNNRREDLRKVQEEPVQVHVPTTGRRSGGRTSHTVYPVKHLLVTGELTTGFQFYGPFDSVAAAGQWATDHLKPGTPHRVHDMFDVGDKS